MHKQRKENLISVILPVYNVESFLGKCIKSITEQTYNNIEILIIDDGSLDGSGDICDEWAKIDSRITVIHQRHRGLSVARNVGIDNSRGDYIMFVDSDDYLANTTCEKLLSAIKKYNSCCSVCGWNDIAEDGSLIETYCTENSIIMSGKEALYEQYLQPERKGNICVVWGKLFYWKVWEKLRFTEGIYYEDLDIMPNLYLTCDKIVLIPYVGYNYLQRVGSISNGTGVNHKRYIDSLNIRIKHIEIYHSYSERELEIVQIQALLDLIITSDYYGWIPNNEKKNSKVVFIKYWRRLSHYSFKIQIKSKIRYGIYRYMGIKGYRFFKG